MPYGVADDCTPLHHHIVQQRPVSRASRRCRRAGACAAAAGAPPRLCLCLCLLPLLLLQLPPQGCVPQPFLRVLQLQHLAQLQRYGERCGSEQQPRAQVEGAQLGTIVPCREGGWQRISLQTNCINCSNVCLQFHSAWGHLLHLVPILTRCCCSFAPENTLPPLAGALIPAPRSFMSPWASSAA